MTQSHPELEAEQRYLDAAYARLDAMRSAARAVAEGYSDVRQGGTHQARLERDAAEAVTRRRLAALDIGDLPLCFGRLDLHAATETDNGEGGARRFYVGRIAVNDEEQTPLVVDWRAPVAEPFYRATGVDPMGIVRRRHFLTKPGNGRELADIDDEVFDREAADASGLTVMGEAALLASLERARTGRMGDIVATIQAEQDQAIRADLPGVLVVAGGPGTGKTAVALHRAAYLLYTYRRQLSARGVLLIGPNSIFLRYIDQVLPSLGEEDVQLSTVAGLKPRYSMVATDPPDVARIKGDARMARVIANALRDREHPLARDMVTRFDGVRLRLRRGASARIVERARRRRGTHNEKRPQVVRSVVEHLRSQYRRALGAAAPDDSDWDREIESRLRQLPEVRAALERMWPILTGGELVHDLFSFEALVRSAADGVIERDAQARLARPRSGGVREVPWTEADLALIDEADSLLGPPESARPRRRRSRRRDDDAASRVVAELGVGGFITADEIARRYGGDTPAPAEDQEDPRTFGHVVVDEAQDLSAMQWRMLGRRCPTGSMTIVGDFGQASKPAAMSSWDDVLGLLPGRTAPRVITLSVNYRTPAEIMEPANRLLVAAAPGIEPARAVRSTGNPPRFLSVRAGDLVDVTVRSAREAAGREGKVAVVAPADLHAELVARLADVDAVAHSAEALDARVAVLAADDAKGLEFDHVVVVEPARLVTPDPPGLRLLYVTLTRATQELVVIHAEPLPEALAATPVSAAGDPVVAS